jgi:hypothetical protein
MRLERRRTTKLVRSSLSANFCIVRDFDVAGSHRALNLHTMHPEAAFFFDLGQTKMRVSLSLAMLTRGRIE